MGCYQEIKKDRGREERMTDRKAKGMGVCII